MQKIAKSITLGVLVTWAVMCGMIALGCKKAPTAEEEKLRLDRAYDFTIEWETRRVADLEGLLPDYFKEARKEAMQLLRARQVGPAPFPIVAAVEKDSEESGYLFLEWLELDKDTKAILLIERDLTTQKTSVESYAWPNPGLRYKVDPEYHLWRTIPKWPVRIRTRFDGSQAKDVAAWHKWEADPRQEDWPPAPTWISLPSASRSVELAICDEMGHISRVIPVHVWAETTEGGKMPRKVGG